MARTSLIRTGALLLAALLLAAAPARAADPAFQRWLESVWPLAQQAGVSRATFETATAGLEPDLSLPELVIPGRPERPQGAQAEFVRPPADYMAERDLAILTAQGRKLAAQHKTVLAAIERQYGVPGPMILAIWGRETNFGAARLKHSALRVLATQAYTGKRKDYFRAEFVAALKILEEDHIEAGDMKSSWAGALGLMQFMPSGFLKYAVDFDRDGRRDIWTSVPDALASAARQLLDKGWRPGKGWAHEVTVPKGLDCTVAEPDITLPVREWLKRGVAPVAGRPIPAADLAEPASLFLPAGTHGPAFLTLKNFYVIKEYNFADLYALFVGHAGDRIAGAGPFVTPWAPLKQLKTADLEAMQRGLAAAGLYRDKIDGKAGQKTRVAVGAFEKASGLPVDCWPDPELLARLAAPPAR